MKKYLIICAAALALQGTPLLSQEADSGGFSADLSVIPLLDAGGAVPMGKSERKAYFDLGNSSLYTLFEGTLAKNLTFSVINHWASFGLTDGAFDSSYTTDLYYNTFRTDSDTWTDCFYLRYSFGNFEIGAGKDLLFSEGMEGDEYDWDVHPYLCSSYWNMVSSNEWGATFSWTNNAANTSLALQVCTSPYGATPESGLLSYGFKWNGEYGPLRGIWTFSYLNTGNGYYPFLCLGQTFSLTEDLSLSLDYWNTSCDWEKLLQKGHSAYLGASWAPSDKFDLLVRAGLESRVWNYGTEPHPRYMGGCALHWYPIEGLRVHLSLAANEILDGYYYAFAGITYNLNLHIGK